MLVVDASVAVQWYLPQERSRAAETILGLAELAGPLLLQLEVAAVLLRAVRQGDLDAKTARRAAFHNLPRAVRLSDEPNLMEAAFPIAADHGGSVYDAVYIALAKRYGTGLITDDLRMHRVAVGVGVGARLLGDT